MGKKKHKDRDASRTINVEIAPGNQEKMDLYIKAYNHGPDRATPRIKYTDVLNDALDAFLSAQQRTSNVPAARPRRAHR